MKKLSSRLLAFVLAAIMIVPMLAVLGTVDAKAFTIRSSAPATDNKYYVKTTYGGYNECILINESTGECIPNCVGYAWGRAYEAFGKKPNLSKGNANTFYSYNINHSYYPYGSTPKAGSIACWDDGSYGHVAFVESVSGSNVTFTESSYGGTRWKSVTKTTTQMKNYLGSNTLQGYIYLDDSSAPSVTYSDISTGTFFIRNKSTGKYLNADGTASKDNISVASLSSGSSQQKFSISGSSQSYTITPSFNSSLRVNPFADNITNGTNVNLYPSNQESGNDQHWKFEAVSGGGYIIHNQKNTNLVLGLDGTNVRVETASGASDQIWELYPATYSVTFNANGGSGAPGAQTKNYGLNLSLSTTKPSRDGYTFTGWNTKADGTGASYASGAPYTANANVTLYAQWQKDPETYTVSYNANGGENAPAAQTKTEGIALTLSSAAPSRDGYTFTGWNTIADGTGTSYASGASYTTNANVTLYAQWTKNETPTPVDPDAAQIMVESKTVSAGREFTVTVSIKNNPGVMSLMLTPKFSDKLTLVKAENGTLLSEFTKGTKYLWNANEDVSEDGVLMTLTFTTAEDLEPGDYTVDFTLWGSSDSQENDVEYAIVPGVITVTDITWGDANADGIVNNKDIVRLKNYLANLDDETGTSTVEIFPGADANADGVVNNKDIVRLKNYLANLDDETGLSTVVLGPAA